MMTPAELADQVREWAATRGPCTKALVHDLQRFSAIVEDELSTKWDQLVSCH